ncbi:MAG: hypothetical protein KUA43_18095 [Hoeflea sp.]|uniref:hypothetical protein n=1 Tax=Hoeflea sp. TaxID=1940281 RepID=UPI001D310302|nr:hypothetical protein [Hoeflea sp.]MBU4529188.1 hypothetical protein [Alphaproteobacteria bacterium]MBU4543593.1 hypothetical protein [Alphaproteobacteria bacterium]MBU4549218.1 hypothetical protein [Alphaproteobacteria bacterium]MBV1725352.1 hypothetical protein [Hoeflea sp.]MBV1785314.1 hypothetical protein [Hoeflea sp.]
MKATTTKKRDGSEQVMLGRVIWKEKPGRKRAPRQDWSYSRELQRVREIEKLIRARHGAMIPNPAGTDDVDTCLAYVRAVALTPRTQDVKPWCAKWAPWIDAVSLEMIEALGMKRRLMIKADAVAKLLSVTMAERTRLGLRTIGACDMSTADRKKQAKAAKRERDRIRQEQKRRAVGRKDRASYEAASLSRLKPWEVEGISRRTWERRRDASVSRIDITGNGDTLASKLEKLPSLHRLQSEQARAAGLIAGLGDHPPAELQEAAPHGNGDRLKERAA